MISKIFIIWGLYISIIALSTGCVKSSFTTSIKEDTEVANTTGATQLEQVVETEENFKPLAEKEDLSTDKCTPYQFLNLMTGNAEALSFHYIVYTNDRYEGKNGSFYKMGDKSVVIFQADNMKGDESGIRELEMEGHVHYIMDDYKMIKSYLAPAEDFLLYEMMDATNNTPSTVVSEEDYIIYEYRLPFVQDVEQQIIYRFFMKENSLKKMEYSINNQATTTYEFSDFLQTITDERVFDYPTGYNEEWYDYINTGENMPPWWEL
ncbi:MAG: hypothetical protein CVU84_16945 [Firmicutes bacterium HGW-Firmicutes-1]|jgi:hypothetical protein|nr:MAG: hypothetical protein CVU84_16945 [Firmicutes bacterium HGW-Firmicutes-1]